MMMFNCMKDMSNIEGAVRGEVYRQGWLQMTSPSLAESLSADTTQEEPGEVHEVGYTRCPKSSILGSYKSRTTN